MEGPSGRRADRRLSRRPRAASGCPGPGPESAAGRRGDRICAGRNRRGRRQGPARQDPAGVGRADRTGHRRAHPGVASARPGRPRRTYRRRRLRLLRVLGQSAVARTLAGNGVARGRRRRHRPVHRTRDGFAAPHRTGHVDPRERRARRHQGRRGRRRARLPRHGTLVRRGPQPAPRRPDQPHGDDHRRQCADLPCDHSRHSRRPVRRAASGRRERHPPVGDPGRLAARSRRNQLLADLQGGLGPARPDALGHGAPSSPGARRHGRPDRPYRGDDAPGPGGQDVPEPDRRPEVPGDLLHPAGQRRPAGGTRRRPHGRRLERSRRLPRAHRRRPVLRHRYFARRRLPRRPRPIPPCRRRRPRDPPPDDRTLHRRGRHHARRRASLRRAAFERPPGGGLRQHPRLHDALRDRRRGGARARRRHRLPRPDRRGADPVAVRHRAAPGARRRRRGRAGRRTAARVGRPRHHEPALHPPDQP